MAGKESTACLITHCPRTVAHFLPRLSRPRSTHRPRGRRRTELVPAQLTATIRSDGAHTVWPYSCGPTAVSLQLPQRKEEGLGTMLSTDSQEEGMDPSHRLRPQPSLLSQNPAASTYALLRCGRQGPRLFKVSWSRKNSLSISGVVPRTGNLKEGINTFNECIFHTRSWAQRFAVIILLNPHQNLGRQFIVGPFDEWGPEWSEVRGLLPLTVCWVCRTPNARAFPCLKVTLRQRAEAHSNWLLGVEEKATWFLSLPGAGGLPTRAHGVSGSLTQESACATNLCRQPKCYHPRVACCLGPPSRAWGNSRLHRSLFQLLSEN